ncbi:nuclear transport factor 2 family protein [Streptomyces sp. WAC04114]|uniref:nuclear transport factor 2 family protein n=1 Tax=Streptomyces sp. WAC04114 TaxID=2867961 RepID=UPI001C8BBCDB|nr:nuclear transport factor 2 family protein [Streptomyces sp. WAC04114]MBX9360718.1 nuclear transport factor 2 family protein [Streptomyces sp. WAC04114]
MSEKPDPADELQLVRLAKSWAEAIVSDDPARIAGFMADEWVIVSASGIDPREKFLSLLASGALTHSAMDLRTDPRVRVHGDTALVTCRVTNTAHYEGERYDADEWTTDVFVRRQGRWLCVLSHITPAAPA